MDRCLKILRGFFIAYFGILKPTNCVPGLLSGRFRDWLAQLRTFHGVGGSLTDCTGRPGAPFQAGLSSHWQQCWRINIDKGDEVLLKHLERALLLICSVNSFKYQGMYWAPGKWHLFSWHYRLEPSCPAWEPLAVCDYIDSFKWATNINSVSHPHVPLFNAQWPCAWWLFCGYR